MNIKTHFAGLCCSMQLLATASGQEAAAVFNTKDQLDAFKRSPIEAARAPLGDLQKLLLTPKVTQVPGQEPVTIKEGVLEVVYEKTKVVVPDLAQKGETKTYDLQMRMYRHLVKRGDELVPVARMPGPLIEVNPGDVFSIKYQNKLTEETPPRPLRPDVHNEPGRFNTVNFHFHGGHVSPSGNSDNIFLAIGPQEEKVLCFDLPDDHHAGTMWYHTHVHGSTAYHLYSGMLGALLIKGPGLDTAPELKDVKEKVLIFQQLRFRPEREADGALVGRLTEQDAYSPAVNVDPANELGPQEWHLINGQYGPTITMQPGEIQRWRCVHGGISSSINPQLIKKDADPNEAANKILLHEIARDGIPLKKMRTYTTEQDPAGALDDERNRLILHPGYRSDVLVEAPKQPGTYYLISGPLEGNINFTGAFVPERYLAVVEVAGDAVSMTLPGPDFPAQYLALKDFPDEDAPAPDQVAERDMLKRRVQNINFGFGGGHFGINGSEFDDETDIPIQVKLGTAEKWFVSNVSNGPAHPFHIHVNPFLVVKRDAQTKKVVSSYWKDTLAVHPGQTYEIWHRFENFTGDFVIHCHNLQHEDRGMMKRVSVLPNANVPERKSRCPEADGGAAGKPAATPHRREGAMVQPPKSFQPVEVKTPDGKKHVVSEKQVLAGRSELRLFVQGSSCGHCVQQLKVAASLARKAKDKSLCVLVFSPESPDALKQALQNGSLREFNSPEFVFLSDTEEKAFRAYGCNDEYSHGVFATNAKGDFVYGKLSGEPYLELETVFEKL